MKSFISLLMLFVALGAVAQTTPENYQAAYAEITAMLEGTKPLDFKRAVFVVENAYHNGSLSYENYCQQIDDIEKKLRWLIKAKGIEKYKTAPQYAIWSWMTEPSMLNDSTTCTYDFEDFMGQEDWTKMFVTKLLNTKTGNCHSLPYLYKILAEEMNAEAFLALGPNHVYIKHRDEEGQWTNVEMTSGEFPRDGDIMKQLAISVKAVANKVYMHPLSDKQTIALCLWDLAMNYRFENGDDAFTMLCYDKVMQHDPKNILAPMSKAGSLQEKGEAMKAQHNGEPNEAMKTNWGEWKKLDNLVTAMGYTEMPAELYEKWVESVEEEKGKQEISKNH